MLRSAFSALVALLGLAWALLAQAHPMPETRVWVDTRPGGVQLTLDVPLNRLEFAFGQPLADTPQQVLPQHAEALSRYLLLHVGARGAAAGWQALPPQLEVTGEDGSAELHARMFLRAPAGEDTRRFTLLLDPVTHEVKTHRVQVLLRSDWSGGRAAGAPVPLGTLDAAHRELPVALGEERSAGGFGPLLLMGARHIAEGTDHLVFLLLLLVVAPLTAQRGRWSSARPAAGVLRQVLWVVTAFTLGHSVTLVLGSTGVLKVPSQPVEMAVALTILVAAAHAIRPLWRGGEVGMAGAFGLVHGLAFSASLSGAGLEPARHALALLAFNLGIEAMQLTLVIAAIPALAMLAARAAPAYAWLRRGAALGAALLAVLWLADRAGWALPFAAGQLEGGPLAPALFVVLMWLLRWWLCRPAHAVSDSAAGQLDTLEGT